MVEKKKKLTAAELKKFIGKFPNLKKPGEDEKEIEGRLYFEYEADGELEVFVGHQRLLEILGDLEGKFVKIIICKKDDKERTQ